MAITAEEIVPFAGMGHSGRNDLSGRHKQIRDELIAGKRDSGS
jgi:hypothetical protein